MGDLTKTPPQKPFIEIPFNTTDGIATGIGSVLAKIVTRTDPSPRIEPSPERAQKYLLDDAPRALKRYNDAGEECFSPVDSNHTLSNGSMLRNVGVYHDKAAFDKEEGFLYQAIQGADIILMEEGDGYFGQLSEYIRQTYLGSKRTYSIDYSEESNMHFQILGLLLAARLFFWRTHENSSNLTEFIRKLCVVPAVLSTEPLMDTEKHLFKEGVPIHWFLGFLMDGRTVTMLRNALDVAEKNPHKKILILTGDGHAQGFEAYFERPALFAFKTALYNILYGAALVRPRKI